MFPTLVCNKTFVPPTYNGSVSDVGDVVTELVGAGVGVPVKVVGAGVDVGDTFAG
jgi:acetamidase/formamidase